MPPAPARRDQALRYGRDEGDRIWRLVAGPRRSQRVVAERLRQVQLDAERCDRPKRLLDQAAVELARGRDQVGEALLVAVRRAQHLAPAEPLIPFEDTERGRDQ